MAATATTAGTAGSANSVSATNIVGAVQLTQLPGTVLTNNQSGVTLNGTFGGNGGGLTNLNPALATNAGFPFFALYPAGPREFRERPALGIFTNIQDAILALPVAPDPDHAGGGAICFAPGIYYTTTNIYTPNTSYPFSLNLAGFRTERLWHCVCWDRGAKRDDPVTTGCERHFYLFNAKYVHGFSGEWIDQHSLFQLRRRFRGSRLDFILLVRLLAFDDQQRLRLFDTGKSHGLDAADVRGWGQS